MDERAEILAAVKNGTYFAEAAAWYKSTFVSPLKGRGIMLFFGSALFLLALIAASYIYFAFPLIEKVNTVIPLRDTVNFFPNVIPIVDRNKSFKQVVVENLCSRYVNAMESYRQDRFETNYAFIMRSSSKSIFDKYYSFITSSEPNSPVSLNKESQLQKVNVLKTQYTDNDNKVTIVFNKSRYDQFGQLLSVSKHGADIEFYLSDYNFNQPVTSKLDFVVTNYSVYELK
jgi:type IV secretory pathway component VirB8